MKYLLYPYPIDNHSSLPLSGMIILEDLYTLTQFGTFWNLHTFTWLVYLLKIWIWPSLAYFLKLIYLTNTRYKVPTHVKHTLDFSFVFSAPLPARRNLFSASGIFCGGRYQPGCTAISWPVEGTSQPVTISKKWKNSSSALCRKRTWALVLTCFSTYSLGLLALAQV